MATVLVDSQPASPDVFDTPLTRVHSWPRNKSRRALMGEQANEKLRASSPRDQKKDPRYHEDETSQYCLPNDSPEHVRLETQAVHFSEMMYNGEVHVQLPRTIERVLDIGCGTGILTDMLSEMFPTTECIGLDLSPVPQIRSHQSNVRFFKGNGSTQRPSKWVPEDGAPFTQDRNLFDYIFSRLLILGMSDWPAFIRREFELLKPGGWAELQDLAWDWYDPDGTVVSDSWSWLELMKAHTSKEKGMDTLCGRNCKKWMQYAGFVDVQVIPYLFPFCGFSEATPEMREFGRFNTSTVPMMLQDAIPRAMSGRPSEEVDAIVKEMKETLRPGLGRYQIFYVTVGRKPDADKRSL